ncbi:Methyltransferase FkbM domain protein [Candidatus Thiomargarita nelsonii]|uniref:Methyltransferase FkbM domain protein n=1 Tax=Candidatus Thiomargarita nelsonii TaxID=1003181 RepID=A0A0A6P0N8_9GAMM|nr:Methyltransferase FkbM domain protein [Candidatus Thiomargarita nelsonii]
MEKKIRTFIRTMQTDFPFLLDRKFSFQRFVRNMFGNPHEADFNAIALFSDFDNALYLDVGGNRGQSIDSILLFKKNCIVHSFEPNPILHKKLVNVYCEKQNVIIHNFGLGDKTGEFTLYIPFYKNYMFDGLASFHKEEAESWLKTRLYRFNERLLNVQEVKCFIKKLDDLSLSPFFIKLDVQGYEFQALLGAERTLMESRPILLIENPGKRVQSYLADFGYKPYAFEKKKFIPGVFGSSNTFFMTEDREREVDGKTKTMNFHTQ